MNYTKNYQLNQWEPSDRVLREDFNKDNMKIDAALHTMQGALPELVLGTYTGDGSAVRTVDLALPPRPFMSQPWTALPFAIAAAAANSPADLH